VNNLPKVVTQQRRGRASNPRLLDRKSDALPLSHRVDNMNEKIDCYKRTKILNKTAIFLTQSPRPLPRPPNTQSRFSPSNLI